MSAAITDKAGAVCAANWGKRGNGCDKCPLHSACAVRIPAGQDALNAWQQSVNAAAAKVAA